MTPEQEEQVRRALGSLSPEGPVPPEVAARLEVTLADLVSERESAAAQAMADGDELAARRRRRLRVGLVAAASVAVLGIGLGTVVDDLSLDGSAESTSAGDAAVDSDGRAAGPEAAPQEAPGGAGASGIPDGVALLATTRLLVAPETLDRDVARIAALGPVQSAREGVTTDSTEPDGTADPFAAVAPCAVPSTAPGDELAPVVYDGDPATLVLRPPVDGAREAQIYSCDDGGAILASTSVPTR